MASERGLRNILLYLAALHCGLVLWDIGHPAVFMHVDRAANRFEAMEMARAALHDGRWHSVLASLGLPGDYLPHALLYALGGVGAIIAAQLALLFASVWALYRMVQSLTGARAQAAMAALLYIHLPHTLVFPHMLSAEALYDPLVVLAFYWLACPGKNALRNGRGGGLLFGVATLIRPVTLLWPVVVAGAMRMMRRPASACLRLLFWSWLPIAAWMVFVWSASGKWSLGSSGHDMGHNLYQRVERMTAQLPAARRAEAVSRFLTKDEGSEKILSPVEYFAFGWSYPRAFAAHLGSDAMVFFGKSGIERLTIDYIGLDGNLREELQNPDTGWRHRMDSAGMVATLRNMVARAPALVALSIVGAGAIVALWGLYAMGVYRVAGAGWRGNAQSRWTLLLVASFPLYGFAVSQAVDAMQSRHRAPVEFALCAIAAIALQGLLAQRQAGMAKAALP
jgi:hypothetical protein